ILDQVFTISTQGAPVPTPNLPTALSLSKSSIPFNSPAGTVVGTFSTTEAGTGNSFVYTLVSGTGSTDNASFTVSNGVLKSAEAINNASQTDSITTRRSTDHNRGLLFTVFTLAAPVPVQNLPTALLLSNSSIPFNSPAGTVVGTFSTTEAGTGNSFTYTLVSG